jgi:hypothetical protein
MTRKRPRVRAPVHGDQGFQLKATTVDDHLFPSMATRATELWTGLMNAVGRSENQPDLAARVRNAPYSVQLTFAARAESWGRWS